MAKRKHITPLTPEELTTQASQFHEVFALNNVAQLRDAVDQAVYGDGQASPADEEQREHTVETLTTLGQMGLLTETDIDEAKKGYL
jgi:hypothetical protein